MNKFKCLLAAAALLGCVTTASAGTLADVVILDRNTGERLQTWRHGGQLYVAGYPGRRYSVELNNRSEGRLLAVLSVDGVNAITGETAAAGDSGYVLDAWQKTAIHGWRKNLDEVAAFYFTRLPDSYAARTGRPDNVGVIGVALFREYSDEDKYRHPPTLLESPASSRSGSQPSAPAAAPSRESTTVDSLAATRPRAAEPLGTGHGERVTSASSYTEFRRASTRPAEIVVIHYDSRANLVARGIIPGQPPSVPRPFPGDFVPDPS